MENDCLRFLSEEINRLQIKKILFVHGNSFNHLPIKDSINIGVEYIEFTEFSPNPDILDVNKGLKIFTDESCDGILAIGGGSAMDVSKAIKYYSKKQVPFIAVPTTAGSGSEATRFAVIYENKVKMSLRDDSFIPDVTFLDGNVLKTLPSYQRKSAMLDALCQAIESIWSVNSSDESKEYAKSAIELIINNYRDYVFDDNPDSYTNIMWASNLAGKAINITQTTAAHAMAYKITAKYGFAHGHAVATGLPYIWKFMISNLKDCIDSRGSEYVREVFYDIASILGQNNPDDAINWFMSLLKELQMPNPEGTEEDIEELVSSVNLTRLKNNPIELSKKALEKIYRDILIIN